jgi:CzcA family heavy metal efflux pump
MAALLGGVILLLWGGWKTWETEVDVFPDLNAPTVVVMTEAPGLSAAEVERLVSFPVETAVNGAMNVRRVRSSSVTGFSVVTVEFEWGTDIYRARQIVAEKIAGVETGFPEGVSRPVMGPQTSILGEVMIIGVTADSTSLLDLRTLADWVLRPRLLATGGVAQVAVIGGEIKEYRIVPDAGRMRYYGVTLEELLEACRGMNRNAGGGILYRYGNEYIVTGELATADSIELLRAPLKRTAAGEAIRLGDVAGLEVGGKSPRLGAASVEGRKGVLLTVNKQPDVSTLALTERIDAALAEVQKELPADVRVHSDIFRQSDFIDNSIRNVRDSLLEGSLFVALVLIIFLMNVRTVAISLVALPLSLVASVLVLHYLGLTINTMSLGGMAIAIGSLVDDAIVDVENVHKRLRENALRSEDERRGVLEVVYDASREVRMPILNSTLIIVAGFVPLFFLSGMEGRMLAPLGIAFIVALGASTLVALTVTPTLCSLLLGQVRSGHKMKEPAVVRAMKAGYGAALAWAMQRRSVVLWSTGVAFVGAIVAFATLGRSFLPPFNEGSFTVNLSTQPGIALEESEAIGRRAELLLLEVPEIQTVARKTGRAELDEHALGVNESELEAPFVLKDRSREVVMNDVRRKLSVLPGVNVEIGQPISHRLDAMLSGTKASIAVKVFGNDLGQMYAVGNEIREAVENVEGVVDLKVEQLIDRPQLTIRPRREMLAQFGLTLPELEEYIRVVLGGEVVGQVYEKGRYFDLTVKGGRRLLPEDWMIDTPKGQIPLSYVADIRSTVSPVAVNRENAERKLVVSANVSGRDVRSVVNEMQERVAAEVRLPEGYRIHFGGQFESEAAAGRTLALASVLSLLVIFLLLFQEFKSVRESAIILLNLPLALIGGVFILRLTRGEMSIPAIIGFISLFGIATRNGMLLVSRYKQLLTEGMGLQEAIRQGSADRLNPIIMTALSSALALIPLALRGSLPGNEIQSPMAIVILGGLLTSTFLNGFILPVVFEWLHEKKG